MINVFTLIIVIVTAIRVIKTIRSSTLPDAASLHRRQENKLTWLTYNISGVCVACWVPQFICVGLLASDFDTDVVVNAMVIISTKKTKKLSFEPSGASRYTEQKRE